MHRITVLGLLSIISTAFAAAINTHGSPQNVFQQSEGSKYYELKYPIKRVAVIGAGVSGLVGTSVLLDHNFTVRTFERAPKPVLPWKRIQQYVRAFASFRGLNVDDTDSPVSYSTRVELAERIDAGWRLTLRRMQPSPDGSREYRHPEVYTNATVLVVGASSSGIDISREIVPFAKTLFQSIRNSSTSLEYLKLFGGRLAPGAVSVPEVAEYLPNGSSVRLVNGTTLHGIERVILATGYIRTFPFLPSVHADVDRSARHPIVTDGTHVQNLYLDTFYIPDPTLAFTIRPFRFAEYQAAAAAKVWAGLARLPAPSHLWDAYAKQHQWRIPGKTFNDLNVNGTQALVRHFVGWLNAEAVEFGGTQLDGYPPNVWEETKLFVGASGRGADYEPSDPTVPTGAAFALADAAMEEGFGDW
ncbi:hypothetical protein RQP46_005050 [Phenoliferia psychrophenolica]